MTAAEIWYTCVMYRTTLFLIGLLLMCWTAGAQATRPATGPAGGQVRLDAQTVLRYQAQADTLEVADESGKPKARFFYTAYWLDGPTAVAAASQPVFNRPLTFVFNGGPGAASVWLHLGTVGPRRLLLDERGLPIGPPYRVVENADTWLDQSDLVFIDPIGTGFSRPAAGEKAQDFYGVQKDINSVGQFIHLYLSRHGGFNRPLFLAGESYGTTRAVGLATHLHQRYGIDLSGLILISTVLDFQTLAFSAPNDVPYPLYLPAYSAIAAYHHKLSEALNQNPAAAMAQSAEFAQKEYAPALALGQALSQTQREALARRLGELSGLPAELWLKSNLRVDSGTFRAALLAPRQLIGRFDGRIISDNPAPLQPRAELDASLEWYLGAYSSAWNHYVRDNLGFASDLTYETLSDRVGGWDFARPGGGYLYLGDDLRQALLEVPGLKVFVAGGWYDLATPLATVRYTLDHLDLSPASRAAITLKDYPGGHMLYHVPAARRLLTDDVRAFYRSTAPGP